MQIKDVKKNIENNLEELKIKEERSTLLETLRDYEGRDEVISSEQALEMISEERKKPTLKIMSKMPTFDKLVDGFRQGDLVVISAPTKQGKTTLAQSFTSSFSEQGISSLWFSYELRQMDFLEKFGEPICQFSLPKNLSGNSIDWIEQRIMESIAKFGTKVVFIDHLHYILNFSDIKNRSGISLLIGAIMRELKRIANKWDITIFLIAHTTKISYDSQPELSDIRDSSFISQEADMVLMLWRLKDKTTDGFSNESRLVVKANRRTGQTGGVNLIFDPKKQKLYEKTNFQQTDLEI